jgi:hypothetical protein
MMDYFVATVVAGLLGAVLYGIGFLDATWEAVVMGACVGFLTWVARRAYG